MEGFVSYERNLYSVPWRLVGQLLAVRIGEKELIVYDSRLEEIARHELFPRGVKGARREDPAHRPAANRREQLEELQNRYDELGEVARRFLDGLLREQTYGKSQARKVLSLLSLYHRGDVLAAMQRAVRYRAFAFQSLERILAVQAKPKWLPPSLAESYPPTLADDDPIRPRATTEYQPLLFDEGIDGQEENQPPPEDDPAGDKPTDEEDEPADAS